MKTGIYKIQSIKFPERVYIGSAVNFERRKDQHRRDFNWHTHHNSKLQNHVNKYTLYDLSITLIEECKPVQLLIREQFYIDTLKPFFNINPNAESRLGAKVAPTGRLKIKAAAKLRANRKNQDFRTGRYLPD